MRKRIMIKNYMIFGDSYSTYLGYVPEGYSCYYSPQGAPDRPVKKMKAEETWWKRLEMLDNDAVLVRNDSWSGSTVSHTGWLGDTSKISSFIYRFRTLKNQGFFQNNQIDTVFIFGATNDSWVPSPLGEMKFSDWQEEDLFSVKPAICYLLSSLRKELPSAKIVFIINTDINEEIVNCIKTATERYNAYSVELSNISKNYGHPNILGMQQISEQVYNFLKSNVYQ